MRNIASLSSTEREELFLITARKKKLPEAVIEKDFWVCWTLDYLFHDSLWKNHLAFKGGTSLSKCFDLIHRFSEDIDLILDWRLVGCGKDEPWAERSRNQQDKFNKAVNTRTETFLAEEFAPKLESDFRELMRDEFQISIDAINPQTVCFAYPRLFSEGAILPIIRLEIGALAAWTPTRKAIITPFAAEQYPQVFQQPGTSLRTVSPERTFWEKVTILHKESFRTNGKIPPRYSRHYYDLWCMAQSPVKDSAFMNLELLQQVVDFKNRFYPAASARYDLAKPGTMRLMPPDDCLPVLRTDYEHMKNMIFGKTPEFGEILSAISLLEHEIQSLSVF
jgi:predicted nucleotidyltransferase component of viral defense system